MLILASLKSTLKLCVRVWIMICLFEISKNNSALYAPSNLFFLRLKRQNHRFLSQAHLFFEPVQILALKSQIKIKPNQARVINQAKRPRQAFFRTIILPIIHTSPLRQVRIAL